MQHTGLGALVLSGILVGTGGFLAYVGLHDAPAARLARRAEAAHHLAIALARPAGASEPRVTGRAPRGSGGGGSGASVPATKQRPAALSDPSVAGEIATLTIPALGLAAPVVPEWPAAGSLTIPSDVHVVGWDAESPTPGAPGVTLLAGHVNWVGQGEGALGQIGQLVVGDRVVLDWGGRTTTWTISAGPRLSPNTVVHRSLFSDAGPPRLALVTCGGPFVETASGGSYADNVIVLASLAG